MGNGTSIGKVRGLGSAHEGVHHWLVHRFTAIGNLVLVIWLMASIVMLPDLSYGTVTNWLSAPVPATAMVLLIISTFWHAKLGLQVLAEDYIQDAGMKFGVMALLNLLAIGGGAFGIFAVARLALSSGAAGGAL